MPKASKRLKVILYEKGLKQQDVARLAGIAATTLGNILNGKTNTTQDTLMRIADVLKVDVHQAIENNDFHSSRATALGYASEQSHSLTFVDYRIETIMDLAQRLKEVQRSELPRFLLEFERLVSEARSAFTQPDEK